MSLKKLEETVKRGETNEEELNKLVEKVFNNFKKKSNKEKLSIKENLELKEKIASRLKPFLNHENPNVRFAALHALGKTKYHENEEIAEKLKKDKAKKVRDKAKEILEQIWEDEEIV